MVHAISDSEFRALRDLIHEETGIALSDAKRQLVSSRLSRRLRDLKLPNFSAYRALLGSAEGRNQELQTFINCVTTNKTSFFREPHHFEFLSEEILGELKAAATRAGTRRFRLWCAAASTGEEPWSLAMTVRDALDGGRGWDIKMLASDIDTDVLATAERGIYPEDRVLEVPVQQRRAYFDETAEGEYRIADVLRPMIAFRRINLVDPTWPIQTRFHTIFCRNVSIYFDRPTQDRVFRRMVDLLEPGGYLVVGHAESLHWMSDVLEPAAPTLYRAKNGASRGRVSAPVQASARVARVAPERRAFVAPPKVARAAPKAEVETPRTVSSPSLKAELGPGRIIVGEVFASQESHVARTLLGSCVAVCLYDPMLKAGGMNHFLLPDTEDHGGMPSRYGVHAMELLINDLLKLGADRRRLVAKIFGGAYVLKGVRGDVGKRNVEFTREFLAREQIPVVSEYVGGNSGVEVRFQCDTGRAFVRTLKDVAQISAEERSYAAKLNEKPRAPAEDFELFGS